VTPPRHFSNLQLSSPCNTFASSLRSGHMIKEPESTETLLEFIKRNPRGRRGHREGAAHTLGATLSSIAAVG